MKMLVAKALSLLVFSLLVYFTCKFSRHVSLFLFRSHYFLIIVTYLTFEYFCCLYFITAVCVLYPPVFLIKLRWPKSKNIYN